MDSLVRLGPYPGWGLFAAGMLWAASRAIGRIADGPSTGSAIAAAILEALAIAVAAGLAGWLLGFVAELAAGIARARIDRASRSDRAVLGLVERVVSAWERLADVLERRPAANTPAAPPDPDRARLLAQIDLALRPGRLGDASMLIEQFAARFPDDPALRDRTDQLDAARREEVEGSLAEIQAARRVNDTARVLELYRGLGPALELQRRGELERELSRWFLEIIHRRLRGGRIQPDVVELATMVAETFARTVEGASLHASLPTLRRSVGLCPRCAKPYTGTAAACPRCLSGSSGAADAGREEDGSEPGPGPEPEPGPDGAVPGPEGAVRGDQDDGWVFYDEDEREGRDPAA